MPGDDRLQVGVRCKVELKNVDAVSEEVKLYVEVVVHYQDPNCPAPTGNAPSQGGKKFERCTPQMLEKMRVPKLQILNSNQIDDIEEFHMFSPRSGTVFDIRCKRVTLQEVLELGRFPFDRQIVKLKMQTFGSNIQKWFADSDDMPYRIVNNKEWLKNDHIVIYDDCEWKLGWAEYEFIEEERQKTFVLSFGISRDPSFYIWNVALFHFVLVLLSCFTCSIDFLDFGARSQVTYTLLLTLVAFKFVVATFVPKISYLTYLDRYSLFSVFMLGLNIAENFAVAMAGSEDAESADRLFFAAFAGFWLLFHIMLIVFTKTGWFYADWETVRKDDKHDGQLKAAAAICRPADETAKRNSGGGSCCSASVPSDEGRKSAWPSPVPG